MSLCKDCVSGVRHEGTPEGTITKLGGVDVYIATPSGEYDKTKTILYLPDALGMDTPNAKLLADDFARNGWRVVVVDYFEGDPVMTAEQFASGAMVNMDLKPWLGRHPPEKVLEITKKVVEGLKAEGVTKIAAVGYCFGARPGFDLVYAGEVHVVAVSHPSLLKIPDDLKKYAEVSKAPLLINSCEVDQMFPVEAQKVADEILGDGKFAPGYERTYWEGCHHGFAVRGDLSNPKVKAGKEGAFEATVKFFKKHL